MAIETTKFDIQDHLSSPEDVAAYLEAIFEDGDPALIAAGLGDVARSKGMSQIAKAAGVSREGLYKALSADGDPRLSTFLGVIKALGLTLTIEARKAA